MAKNIVVLSDGTSQEGGQASNRNTNVYRIFKMLEDRTPRQVTFYDAGLGTGWNKVTGTVSGAGISRNIMDGYRFISDHYEKGDRIYLFGFSRGAATVRSLAGFIDLFGILPSSRPELIEMAYKIYKTKPNNFERTARREIAARGLDRRRREASRLDKEQSSKSGYKPRSLDDDLYPGDIDAEAQAMVNGPLTHIFDSITAGEGLDPLRDPTRFNNLRKLSKTLETYDTVATNIEDRYRKLADEIVTSSTGDPKGFLRAVELRKRAMVFLSANRSVPAPIEFMGCFDTVSALGLPIPGLNAVADQVPGLSHKFHDFSLCKCVRHAYHALAINDERKQFKPTLWTTQNEEQPHVCGSPGCTEKSFQTLCQVWFTGVHTDIGGGYPHRGLSDITLSWMLRKAIPHGLLLDRNHEEVPLEDFTDFMHDSRDTWIKQRAYPVLKPRISFSDELPRQKDGQPLIVHQTVQLRTQAPTIRYMNGVKEDKKAGALYKPWVFDKGKEGKAYAIEDWVPFDRDELLETQEASWARWSGKIPE